METSAKTRDGIDNLFNNIINIFLERNGVVDNSKEINVKLDKAKNNYQNKSSMCC